MAVFFVGTDQDRAHSAGKVEFPFECIYNTVEELKTALARGPVTGFKLIYRQGTAEEGLRSWRVVKRKIIFVLKTGEFGRVELSAAKYHVEGVDPNPRLALRDKLAATETT